MNKLMMFVQNEGVKFSQGDLWLGEYLQKERVDRMAIVLEALS